MEEFWSWRPRAISGSLSALSLRNLDEFGADLYVALMGPGVAWFGTETFPRRPSVLEASEPPERRAVWTRRRTVIPAHDTAAAIARATPPGASRPAGRRGLRTRSGRGPGTPGQAVERDAARRRLARSLRARVKDAEGSAAIRMSAAVPLCRRAVQPWRESLLGLAERLERPDRSTRPASPGCWCCSPMAPARCTTPQRPGGWAMRCGGSPTVSRLTPTRTPRPPRSSASPRRRPRSSQHLYVGAHFLYGPLTRARPR